MEREQKRQRSLRVEWDEPLIAIPFEEDGHEYVEYFVDDAAADAAIAERGLARDPFRFAGIWKDLDPDLDWEEIADELDRIRHESKPTPIIDDLEL